MKLDEKDRKILVELDKDARQSDSEIAKKVRISKQVANYRIQNLIKRDIFNQIIDHLKEKEMTVIVGPRQVGKTTLLGQMKDYLIKQNQINPDSLFYFNLDLTKDLSLFSEQENIINFICVINNLISFPSVKRIERLAESNNKI